MRRSLWSLFAIVIPGALGAALLLPASSCVTLPEPSSDFEPFYKGDADGDGYFNDEDCDDHLTSVYPGAPEVCDGLDNDCDGVLPEDEKDLDGDGYRVCDADCDDSDDASYPYAAEQCDGIDNDCDGEVPDDETDGDGDGFWPCEGDCDDGDAMIAPSSAEVCDDEKDNDCDGFVDDLDPDCWAGDDDDSAGDDDDSAGDDDDSAR